MTNPGSKISTQIPGISTELLHYAALFARIQAGHSLITANSRLTRVLTNEYNQWRISKGDKQWQSPDIGSWNQWLDKLWVKAGLLGVAGTDLAVPGSRQLVNLWENTLKNETLAKTLLRPESLASQLRDTRQLITEWQVNLNDPAWSGHENENHAAFHQWNQAFERLCKLDGWISPDDRIAVLSGTIESGVELVSSKVDLIGFDEYNPAQSRLLNALLGISLPVCHLTIEPKQSKAVMWKSRDNKDEVQQMARWVRYWFEREPDASIAVVVHDLQARRQEIERVLAGILTPASQNNLQDARPWNTSMGVPLLRIPMIEAAFDLLRMLDTRIDIQDIGRVLRSPWLHGGETERTSRALLEKRLREKYPRQLKLSEFLYRSDEMKTHDRYANALPEDEHTPQAWHSPLLNAGLKTLTRFEKNNKQQRPPSAWAELLNQLLMSLGWAKDEADAELSDKENEQNWQALQAWRECLRELASLDATSSKLGRSTAINQLRQICREKIFQAHSSPSNVQILGLYEISGLQFDHLWVLGLHNDNWPGSAKPNPFIPGKLQRQAGLPNSSPQRELKVAHTITRRLLVTAPDCVFSFPGQLDGEDLLPSPLLDNDEIIRLESIPCWQKPDWSKTVANAEKPLIDKIVAPGVLIHKTTRGGSSILKNQALCPFRAFATNRLGAEGMETPVDGISAMLHGSLVHKVLELFWKETKSQSALLQLDEQALTERVQKHVAEVTNEERGLKQRPAFLEVEAQRVHRHVEKYLELEKLREDFVVTGFEKEILPELAGQVVRLVIDRVDRLASGEEIIIDYKTGMVDPKKWFGDRPEDPQLPLYAISAGETPAAVSFGIIKDDACEFKGIVNREGLLPGLPPRATVYTREQIEAGQDMAVTIDSWRQTLHRIMAEFLEGEAAIEPGNDKTCENTYCNLHPLCRVNELRQYRDINQSSAIVSDAQEASS